MLCFHLSTYSAASSSSLRNFLTSKFLSEEFHKNRLFTPPLVDMTHFQTPSSIVGRQAPAPTPSRSESATAARARSTPGAALARGLVAIVAHLWSHEDLAGIAGSSGAPVACGAVQGAVGG